MHEADICCFAVAMFCLIPDMEVKTIKKRASGQAFEVILKPPSPVSDAVHNFPSPPKRAISLEDIEKKLEAAEDRRKVGHLAPGSFGLSKSKFNRGKCCLVLVPGGPGAEGLGREAGAREGCVAEGHGGEQQLQQDGRGETPDEDGPDQGEPRRPSGSHARAPAGKSEKVSELT